MDGRAEVAALNAASGVVVERVEAKENEKMPGVGGEPSNNGGHRLKNKRRVVLVASRWRAQFRR